MASPLPAVSRIVKLKAAAADLPTARFTISQRLGQGHTNHNSSCARDGSRLRASSTSFPPQLSSVGLRFLAPSPPHNLRQLKAAAADLPTARFTISQRLGQGHTNHNSSCARDGSRLRASSTSFPPQLSSVLQGLRFLAPPPPHNLRQLKAAAAGLPTAKFTISQRLGQGHTKQNSSCSRDGRRLLASATNFPQLSSVQCVVLDIEGTTSPMSFVTDVLFPYARDNVRKHLDATYGTDETKDDIALLRAQVEQDLAEGVASAVPVPPDEAGKDKVVDALVANVEAMIKADRKIRSLKQLQGHIWRTGFEGQEFKGVVFEDVPPALEKWHSSGIKTYIYSSGSREAQRLIFGNTTYGDLRKYLCGFFDTTVGTKREARSYYEIWQSVGVDRPSQILFLTDVYQEATAAKAAGLEVLISIRPGNAPLPENHGFQTITSFAEILT